MVETNLLSKQAKFVNYIMQKIKTSTAAMAALKRADNPNLAYQSWEILAAFNINSENVDLENNSERLSYATIAAAIARSKAETNGVRNLGRALALCNPDQPEQLTSRLRRLLACESTDEACRVLRPIFSLIESRGVTNLDYVKLLGQLNYFYSDQSREKTKLSWVKSFYSPEVVKNEQ